MLQIKPPEKSLSQPIKSVFYYVVSMNEGTQGNKSSTFVKEQNLKVQIFDNGSSWENNLQQLS